MAYTGFPATYPQYYPQYSQMSPTPMSGTSQQQNNPFIWIQGGIAGAQSYQVAPNNTVILWDSCENVIYIKSADAYGMPSIKILDYVIRDKKNKKNGIYEEQKYITKSEVSKEIERLEKMIHDAMGVNPDSAQVE